MAGRDDPRRDRRGCARGGDGHGVLFACGVAALAYAVIYAIAVLPGIPLGIALWGRRHPAAWIGGALFGYGLTQMGIWLVIATRLASPIAFAAVWAGLLGAAILVWRPFSAEPIIRLSLPSKQSLAALFLVLLLVPVLMGPPYANLGRSDDQGNRYYRAYFTADFLWHSAL